jgi:hypothetical protein
MRPLLLTGIFFVLLAATAAAGTLLVLRGSVIPAPQKANLQPPMIVRPDTAKLSGVTAIDPTDHRTWTVRLAKSETGLTCLTAGELRGGSFGITGLDGKFRALAPGFTDGCGAPYVGARVFDARTRRDVRTVVDGFAPGLRHVVLDSANGTRNLDVSNTGVFVGVVAGYPEDIGIRVKLTFANGRTETHTFGRSPFVVPDVGGATRTFGYQVSGYPHTGCVRVMSAREVKPFSSSPVACGDIRKPFFFTALTLRQGTHGDHGMNTWNWQHPSRTVVYGSANKRLIKSMTLVGAGRAIRIRPALGSAFQLLFPATVDPQKLILVVTLRNGTVERAPAPAHLVPPPGAHR